MFVPLVRQQRGHDVAVPHENEILLSKPDVSDQVDGAVGRTPIDKRRPTGLDAAQHFLRTRQAPERCRSARRAGGGKPVIVWNGFPVSEWIEVVVGHDVPALTGVLAGRRGDR